MVNGFYLALKKKKTQSENFETHFEPSKTRCTCVFSQFDLQICTNRFRVYSI